MPYTKQHARENAQMYSRARHRLTELNYDPGRELAESVPVQKDSYGHQTRLLLLATLAAEYPHIPEHRRAYQAAKAIRRARGDWLKQHDPGRTG